MAGDVAGEGAEIVQAREVVEKQIQVHFQIVVDQNIAESADSGKPVGEGFRKDFLLPQDFKNFAGCFWPRPAVSSD
jgi:hypothetical protein